MEDIEINSSGVERLLKNLNANKVAGPDNIKPRLLKELATNVAPSLAAIFRRSYAQGGTKLLANCKHHTSFQKRSEMCGRELQACIAHLHIL